MLKLKNITLPVLWATASQYSKLDLTGKIAHTHFEVKISKVPLSMSNEKCDDLAFDVTCGPNDFKSTTALFECSKQFLNPLVHPCFQLSVYPSQQRF